VTAGNGGPGCISYVRTQYSNRIPMGGNGGDGGSVIFKANYKISNLFNLKKAHYKGNNGKGGMSKNCAGKNGGDIYIRVPVGTSVYEIPELSKDPKNFGLK
jgi:GTP-binding protein